MCGAFKRRRGKVRGRKPGCLPAFVPNPRLVAAALHCLRNRTALPAEMETVALGEWEMMDYSSELLHPSLM